jgi:hypothetical protein
VNDYLQAGGSLQALHDDLRKFLAASHTDPEEREFAVLLDKIKLDPESLATECQMLDMRLTEVKLQLQSAKKTIWKCDVTARGNEAGVD